jgi:hypothetical protein
VSLLGFAGVLVVALVAVGSLQGGSPRRPRKRGAGKTEIQYQGARS